MDKLTHVKATPIVLKNHPDYDEQWLKKEDGFVITAFLTRRRKQLERRREIWKR